jgi:hypothetical protein
MKRKKRREKRSEKSESKKRVIVNYWMTNGIFLLIKAGSWY